MGACELVVSLSGNAPTPPHFWRVWLGKCTFRLLDGLRIYFPPQLPLEPYRQVLIDEVFYRFFSISGGLLQDVVQFSPFYHPVRGILGYGSTLSLVLIPLRGVYMSIFRCRIYVVCVH